MRNKEILNLESAHQPEPFGIYDIKVEVSARVLRMGPELTTSTPHLDIIETTSVREDLAEILGTVHRIEEMLKTVSEKPETSDESENAPIELLDIDDAKAEEMVAAYMKEHGTAWPQDAAEALRSRLRTSDENHLETCKRGGTRNH